MPTVWIDTNDQVVCSDSIVITTDNDGLLQYIEMDSIIDINEAQLHHIYDGYVIMDGNGNILYVSEENLHIDSVNIRILENEMPEPYTHEQWLSEGVNQILQPTPQDEGYVYVWESDCWPQDSIYQSYTLEITQPGFYRCNMFDQCLHYSKVEYIVHYSPKIEYVTTNLFVNRNELHWIPDSRNDYDTVAIFRDFQFVEYWEYSMGIWVDPIFNNEDGSNLYTLRPVKYGTIMDGRSKWKTGVSLTLHHVYEETIDISFIGPDQEGIALEDYVQFYQLYSVESNGWGLVRSMIPIEINDLNGIENDYDTLVIAAVTFDGQEIYSNMIFPHAEVTKCEENIDQNFNIYPNPTTGILNLSEFINSEYQIFDTQGRVVMTGNLKPQINVESLSKGLYTIMINGNKQPITRKFILE